MTVRSSRRACLLPPSPSLRPPPSSLPPLPSPAAHRAPTAPLLRTLFETLTLNDAKKQALLGLGAAPTDGLRAAALDYALSGAVKLQDFFYVALTMHRFSPAGMEATCATPPPRAGAHTRRSSHPSGCAPCAGHRHRPRRGCVWCARDRWAHFTANLPTYVEMVGQANPALMDACIAGACSSFATAEKRAEVEAFFCEHAGSFERNGRKIEQTLEAIGANCAYLEAIKASEALEWLRAYKPPAPLS